MEDEDPYYSVVNYLGNGGGHRCGYCKLEDTNISHGMWAYKLTTIDYQNLIDRGWRRSGSYCYKPTMNKTCCPQYTIRCDALNFKLSKSQKKVLKRMHSFLSFGKELKQSTSNETSSVSPSDVCPIEPPIQFNDVDFEVQVSSDSLKTYKKDQIGDSVNQSDVCSGLPNLSKSEKSPQLPLNTGSSSNTTSVKLGLGADPSKPACKKAKLLRKERYAQKKALSGKESPPKSKKTESKSLEDFINAPLTDFPAHRLEFRLVPVDFENDQFSSTFDSSYDIFRLYQMQIHKDPPEECRKHSFKNFLVDGPLTSWTPTRGGPPMGYGAFHQQYWLDGELIAVGVLDVLPFCVSSVYLYYNPKYSFLSLGTYSSLREIALTRELHRNAPSLKWYYMGFYIHSCPKMRYKGNYDPSFLLCPETYNWVSIDICRAKLDVQKYSRLSDIVPSVVEELDVNKVLCLYNRQPCLWANLRFVLESEEDQVKEYLSLVGPKIASTMLLYQS